MKTIVYNKNTGLGGFIIREVGCNYYNVAWFDGTFSVVDNSEFESNWFNKAYYYLPNLQLRVERWTIENRGEIISVSIAISFILLMLLGIIFL